MRDEGRQTMDDGRWTLEDNEGAEMQGIQSPSGILYPVSRTLSPFSFLLYHPHL
jgi:hypothetical protein